MVTDMYKILTDTHTHTIFSGHAYSTIEENVRAAKEQGMEADIRCGPAEGGGFCLEIFPTGTATAQEIEILFAESWREAIPYTVLKKEGIP